jgi:hypothetical protein
MHNGKTKLEDKDLEILESCKIQLDIHINHLLERDVRPANIEIELVWHIKKLLKGE